MEHVARHLRLTRFGQCISEVTDRSVVFADAKPFVVLLIVVRKLSAFSFQPSARVARSEP